MRKSIISIFMVLGLLAFAPERAAVLDKQAQLDDRIFTNGTQ
jgi:hypothetical protein